MSRFKKILPLLLLISFGFLIFYYYKKNESDFLVIQKLNYLLFSKVILLCFFYLLTEGLLLKNIVVFLGKKISLFKSFLIMSATYFCNTFIQFSGLGYRVYYLKKFKKIKISEILRFSLDTIACELFIFSLFGLISISLIDLSSNIVNFNNILYILFLFFFLSSIIYLNFLNFFTFKIKYLLNKMNIFILDKVFKLFLIKKKNIFLFYKKQFLIFVIQYALLFLIFFLMLYKMNIDNFFYISFLVTSLLDFSFLIALTPYSLGISEFITFAGTRDVSINLAEIIILINVFRFCMLIIYFFCGPLFIIINLKK